MGDEFFVPIATMLAGLGVWIVYFGARMFSDAVRNWSSQAEMGLALVVGGLIVVSGFT